jgi:hypothetical protein
LFGYAELNPAHAAPTKRDSVRTRFFRTRSQGLAELVAAVLEQQRATTRNLLFSFNDVDHGVAAFGAEWAVAVLYTVPLSPTGEVVYRSNESFDSLPLKRVILKQLPDDHYIGTFIGLANPDIHATRIWLRYRRQIPNRIRREHLPLRSRLHRQLGSGGVDDRGRHRDRPASSQR